MNLLLINKNPVVSRMLKLSAPKVGFEVFECDNVYELPKGHYEVVILDDEMYDENFLKEIKRSVDFEQIGIITSLKNENIEGFDFTLIKPFLPTDLIELLRGIKSKIEFIKKEQTEEQLDKELAEEITEQDSSEVETELNILTLNEEENEPELESKTQETKEEPKENIVQFEEEEEEEPFVNEEHLDKSGILDEKELEKVQELLEDEDEKEIVAKEVQDIEEESTEDSSIKEEREDKPSILEKVEEYKKSEEPKPLKEEYSSEEKIKALMGVLDLYTVRELLDGMEITIKINFNKKKKKKR